MISYEIIGLAEVQSAIARLGLAAKDTLPVRKVIAEEIITRTHERWQRGEAPDGTKWDPSKRVVDHGGQTLIDHANLIASIYPSFSGGDLEIATNDIRARVHNEGLTITPKRGEFLVWKDPDTGKLIFARAVKMPKRQFMPEFADGDSDSQYVTSTFLEYFVDAFMGGPS